MMKHHKNSSDIQQICTGCYAQKVSRKFCKKCKKHFNKYNFYRSAATYKTCYFCDSDLCSNCSTEEKVKLKDGYYFNIKICSNCDFDENKKFFLQYYIDRFLLKKQVHLVGQIHNDKHFNGDVFVYDLIKYLVLNKRYDLLDRIIVLYEAPLYPLTRHYEKVEVETAIKKTSPLENQGNINTVLDGVESFMVNDDEHKIKKSGLWKRHMLQLHRICDNFKIPMYAYDNELTINGNSDKLYNNEFYKNLSYKYLTKSQLQPFLNSGFSGIKPLLKSHFRLFVNDIIAKRMSYYLNFSDANSNKRNILLAPIGYGHLYDTNWGAKNVQHHLRCMGITVNSMMFCDHNRASVSMRPAMNIREHEVKWLMDLNKDDQAIIRKNTFDLLYNWTSITT
ncbi:MAG: hypothetical protein GY750_04440 [Lentisphaerae bacterium]|nr:hypothetical protein [Lentisphaerota bacterium]MCP4100660.1 hypothetical protein [Lentisphaerota bacterium]